MGGRGIALVTLAALGAAVMSGGARAQPKDPDGEIEIEPNGNGNDFAQIADVSLGTAVVAAGFTAYWYLIKYRQRPRKPEDRHPPLVDAKLDAVPWVQPQSGGVTIAGWF